jgi:hypothetical protein
MMLMLLVFQLFWNTPAGFYPEPSLAQQVVQAEEPPGDQKRVDNATRNAVLGLAMGLSLFFSSLAFGIAYGIRRRIDQIAGPPPEEDEEKIRIF